MKDDPQKAFWNLPNGITLLRIALIPAILVAIGMMAPESAGRNSVTLNLIAAALFSVTSSTDMLDGYLARKYNTITLAGKLFDPLADKLLIGSTLIMLIGVDRAPAWIVVIIIGREIAVTGLRSIAAADGMIIAASNEGKRKTLFQVAAIIGLLVHDTYLTANFYKAGTAFLYIALFYTVYTGYSYFRAFLPKLIGR
jgi:CDP-diacylglycerol--glycerol-3-phosphate 3-phosphatidyltransferase